MTRNRIIPVTLLAVALMAGCSTPPTKREIGTVTGAVVGGVVGSSLTGGSTVGTVGGAAVGGVIGNRIGKELERK
jgi:osmotically inducible lipoprotein OsmB